jgi:carboxyl-terminal processing protease
MNARQPASRRPTRSAAGLAAALCLLLGAGLWLHRHEPEPELEPAQDRHAAADGSAAAAPAEPPLDEGAPRALPLPSGSTVGIGCDEALHVGAFLRRELATPAIEPLPSELTEAWVALLDPHGLWSAAPDSPLESELSQAAPEMLSTLYRQQAGCEASARVGEVFAAWTARLAAEYDAAFAAAQAEQRSDEELFALLADPIFEDDPVTRPAAELAREIGARLGAFGARFPGESSLLERARSRYFPTEVRQLTEMVTLAALRAYVPLVDPHGDFAPLDEEWALYAGDSTLDGGSPLWRDVVRTPLGARVVDDPAPPLQLDDLVLAIDGLSLAGASLDQIEQAARSAAPGGRFELRVLRRGEPGVLSLSVSDQRQPTADALYVERIHAGHDASFVLRVEIPDVSDWLGEDLAAVLAKEAQSARGVLLDLRGNGGGSLDAAVDVLGQLLPGRPLFPLIRRGQVSEVLQAPRPSDPYLGPVAALVDGDTASAAEMIAGAIQAYGRGQVLGVRTFGKGCVQEYFDHVAASGVLRMTTLQFVMPDGKPLQQVGLTPDLLLPLAPATERESQITRQPITFDGPDVRDQRAPVGPAWPRSRAAPGPCEDSLVCLALARLSGAAPAASGAVRAARPRAGMR